MGEEKPQEGSRPKRERKQVDFFKPEQSLGGKKDVFIIEGAGIKLGEIPNVKTRFKNCHASDDTVVGLHRLLYGTTGKSTTRKKDILAFSGFPVEGEDAKQRALERAQNALDKWKVSGLNDLCTMFDIPRGSGDEGKKESKVERLLDFLMEPKVLGSKNLADQEDKKKQKKAKKEKAAAAPKRKAAGNSEQPAKKKRKKEEKEEAAEEMEVEEQEEVDEEEARKDELKKMVAETLQEANRDTITTTQLVKLIGVKVKYSLQPYKKLIKQEAIKFFESTAAGEAEEEKGEQEEQEEEEKEDVQAGGEKAAQPEAEEAEEEDGGGDADGDGKAGPEPTAEREGEGAPQENGTAPEEATAKDKETEEEGEDKQQGQETGAAEDENTAPAAATGNGATAAAGEEAPAAASADADKDGAGEMRGAKEEEGLAG